MQPQIQLTLGEPAQSLPKCLPNLMPFHIKHTGPAPISTYFCVESAPDVVGAPPPTDTPPSGSAPLDASTSQTTEGDSQNTLVDASSSARPAANTSKRLRSTFRGRIVQGLNIDIPEGYVGVILKSGEEQKKSAHADDIRDLKRSQSARRGRAKATGRGTRRSTRSVPVDDVVDVDGDTVMDDDTPFGDIEAADELGNTSLASVPMQQLQVVSQFSQLIVWHPDIPVDEHSDDYIRALKEWSFLASEIHRIEDT
ncbi:hypothetical protein BDN72DRAFT_150526 [Pluteus cervinus]|uniref:Uncharacterized protein n=1 Tax=Pluteus cervinus TaxID=181527 RepID=A0ACD3B7B2_9AGAR|nr:hypothetical protein BDN72DRAFT_150526 [Pluteus cervinus]